MNNLIRKIVNGLLLVLTVLSLSGCMTNELHTNIKNTEITPELYNQDVIIAATISESGKENYSWVFIGNNFDYALTSGASDFLRALVSGKIDKARVSVSENGIFELNKEKNQFSGEITLKYRYRDQTERALIMDTLKQSKWRCPHPRYDGDGTGVCEIKLDGLKGTIHQKAHVPADVFRFDHPINVKFYACNTLSAKRLLYPAAVAADVMMSPLYLLSGVALLSIYGIILLH